MKEKLVARCNKCDNKMEIQEVEDKFYKLTCPHCGAEEFAYESDPLFRTFYEIQPGEKDEDPTPLPMDWVLMAFSLAFIFFGLLFAMNARSTNNAASLNQFTTHIFHPQITEKSTTGYYFEIPKKIEVKK